MRGGGLHLPAPGLWVSTKWQPGASVWRPGACSTKAKGHHSAPPATPDTAHGHLDIGLIALSVWGGSSCSIQMIFLTSTVVHGSLHSAPTLSTAASGFFGCATSPDGGDACSNMRWVPSGVLSNYSPAAGLIPTITAYKGDAYIVSPNCLG